LTLQFLDAPIVPRGVEEHPLDLAGPGADRFFDRMQAGEDHADRSGIAARSQRDRAIAGL